MNAVQVVRSALGAAKARSLIITFMGDVVSVQPRRIWLGSLIAAMQPLGLSENLVRTTCNRLVRAGWLQSRRRGRRTYFHFSAFGLRQYQRAAARIYAPSRPQWDGLWTIILAGSLLPGQRDQLAEQLGWLGFNRLRGHVLIHAGFGREHEAVLRELEIDVPVFRAEGATLGDSLLQLCRDAWALDGLNQSYSAFVDRFAPLAIAPAPSPQEAFQLRFSLIHEYRRIVLTDPELPESLVPEDWCREAARDLAAILYHQWLDGSEAWLGKVLHTELGGWPACANLLRRRFRDATWTPALVALA